MNQKQAIQHMLNTLAEEEAWANHHGRGTHRPLDRCIPHGSRLNTAAHADGHTAPEQSRQHLSVCPCIAPWIHLVAMEAFLDGASHSSLVLPSPDVDLLIEVICGTTRRKERNA